MWPAYRLLKHQTFLPMINMTKNRVLLASLIGLMTSLDILGHRQDPCFAESVRTGPPSVATKPPAADTTPSELLETVKKELGAAATPEEKDPLIIVLELMKESELRLARKDTGQQTQEIQKRIITVFDTLMNQAMEQRQQQPAQGSTPDTSQQAHNQSSETTQTQSTQNPKNTSSASGSPSRATQNVEFTQVLEKIWGELPERERAAVLQHAAEAIVPRYRVLIETYYRELSRGQEASP